MARYNFNLPVLFVLNLLIVIHAQHFAVDPQVGPPRSTVDVRGLPNPGTLADKLTINFSPINEAAYELFPLSILMNAETPIAIRYATMTSASRHELIAACHPKALSFFGTRDPIRKEFCDSPDARARIVARLQYILLSSEHPYEGASWGRYISRMGVDISDTSRNLSTEAGWANFYGDRIAKYFATDGWNSQGDLSKTHYRQQFQDYTGYEPQNVASLPADKLVRPLRWQPLTASSDQHGGYSSQVHVVPQIGIKAKPLVLSPENYESRQAPSPYENPDSEGGLTPADTETGLELIQKLFERSKGLTHEKILRAFWWEAKFLSLGIVVSEYRNAIGFSDQDSFRFLFGDALALHDSVLVAWKEKRRHDLVRPTTLVRHLMKGKKVTAWRGVEEGVGEIDAEEWEPVIPVQPHSEYPSGSAAVCWSAFEHLRAGLEDSVLQPNETIRSFDFILHPEYLTLAGPSNPVKRPFRVTFETPEDGARSCGESRLDVGVHFEPSIDAGYDVAKGIGKIAYKHALDLYNGIVPENCDRCIKQ